MKKYGCVEFFASYRVNAKEEVRVFIDELLQSIVSEEDIHQTLTNINIQKAARHSHQQQDFYGF